MTMTMMMMMMMMMVITAYAARLFWSSLTHVQRMELEVVWHKSIPTNWFHSILAAIYTLQGLKPCLVAYPG